MPVRPGKTGSAGFGATDLPRWLGGWLQAAAATTRLHGEAQRRPAQARFMVARMGIASAIDHGTVMWCMSEHPVLLQSMRHLPRAHGGPEWDCRNCRNCRRPDHFSPVNTPRTHRSQMRRCPRTACRAAGAAHSRSARGSTGFDGPMGGLPEACSMLRRYADRPFAFQSRWFGHPPLCIRGHGHARLRRHHAPDAARPAKRHGSLLCMHPALHEPPADEDGRNGERRALTAMAGDIGRRRCGPRRDRELRRKAPSHRRRRAHGVGATDPAVPAASIGGVGRSPPHPMP